MNIKQWLFGFYLTHSDDEAAQTVRDIFRWYIKDGMSKSGIVRKLNELRIPNPTAYKKLKGMKYANPNSKTNDTLWNTRTIRDILTNQMYLGHMVQGKYRIKSYKVHTQITTPKEEWYIVENTHNAIIEQHIFDMAQKLQEKDTRTPPGKKTIYTLSGFVKCADCKKSMVRSQGGGKTKTSYYQCRTYREKSKDLCSIHSIRADILEYVVLSAIKVQAELVTSISDIIDEINSMPNVSNECCRIAELQNKREKELAKMTVIRDSLYEDWKNGDITKEDYHRLRAKYEEQAESIRKSIDCLNKEQLLISEANDGNNIYLQTFLKHQKIDTLDRSAVVDLINMIYIHKCGEVEIQFNFQDQHKSIIAHIESNMVL